jgi:hypothetical protein
MMKTYASDELRHAAARGDSKALRKLLRAGADPVDLDNAALRRALRHGHSKTIQLLLEAGADWSANMEEFLKLAAGNRDGHCLKRLLRAGKSDIPQAFLNEALYAAITATNTQGAAILIAAGANPHADGDRAALLAASAGRVSILKILHRHGVRFDDQTGLILFNSVVASHLEATRYILSTGVNVNARSDIATTLAVVSGDSEILESLLAAGGTLQHPFLITDAADSDSVETLLILIRRGFEFHTHAEDIAMNAVRHNAPRALQYVYENSAISQRARDLELQVAADKASEKVLDFLLLQGADATADTSDALKRAVKAQKIPFAQKLISAGANVGDLDASAFVATVKADHWPFLTELLRRSIPVAGVLLSPDDAPKFFRQTSPQAFLHDLHGHLLPAHVRTERNRFAKANGSLAAKKSGDEAIFVSTWLAKFLKIQGGHT